MDTSWAWMRVAGLYIPIPIPIPSAPQVSEREFQKLREGLPMLIFWCGKAKNPNATITTGQDMVLTALQGICSEVDFNNRLRFFMYETDGVMYPPYVVDCLSKFQPKRPEDEVCVCAPWNVGAEKDAGRRNAGVWALPGRMQGGHGGMRGEGGGEYWNGRTASCKTLCASFGALPASCQVPSASYAAPPDLVRHCLIQIYNISGRTRRFHHAKRDIRRGKKPPKNCFFQFFGAKTTFC